MANWQTDKEKTKPTKADIKREVSPHVEDIREDFDSLKSNVVGLATNIKEIGVDRARVAADYLAERVDDLKATSLDMLEKTENRIRTNPRQSMALAFAAGMLTSFFLSRGNQE